MNFAADDSNWRTDSPEGSVEGPGDAAAPDPAPDASGPAARPDPPPPDPTQSLSLLEGEATESAERAPDRPATVAPFDRPTAWISTCIAALVDRGLSHQEALAKLSWVAVQVSRQLELAKRPELTRYEMARVLLRWTTEVVADATPRRALNTVVLELLKDPIDRAIEGVLWPALPGESRRQDREDVAQETRQKWVSTFVAERGKARSFAQLVATAELASFLRKEYRRQRAERATCRPTASTTDAPVVHDEASYEAVRRRVEGVGIDPDLLAELTDAGLTQAEIAECLGMSRTKLWRLRKKLRRDLDD